MTDSAEFRALPARPDPKGRILVICTRRIGDVLLCSVLLRSIKQAWPDCPLDVVTNRGSAAILQGNPDIDELIPIDDRVGAGEFFRVARKIFRRYALCACALPNDRQHFLAYLAAPLRVSAVPQSHETGGRWKRRLSQAWVSVDFRKRHAVVQYLKLADCLRIPRATEVVAPRALLPADLEIESPYVVLHVHPMYRFKAWHDAGWTALAKWLASQGLRVVFSGSPNPGEVEHVTKLAASLGASAINLCGKLSLAQLAELLRGAKLYVGPDTSVSHLAAACGTPTVALFGASPPIVWGPWPQGTQIDAETPWADGPPLQHRSNVWIVQGRKQCAPCRFEGCDRHVNSRADCMDELPAARVITVCAQALSI